MQIQVVYLRELNLYGGWSVELSWQLLADVPGELWVVLNDIPLMLPPA